MLSPEDRIFVAGHRGLAGSALVRGLRRHGYHTLLLKTREELDLLDQAAVREFFATQKPDVVFLAAALVGGIGANVTYPADFIYENLMVQTNVLEAAFRSGVRRLLFLGSSCIYPRLAPQPIREEHLLSGPLEPTNAPYAIAKISGIMFCESLNRQYGTQYRSVMPTNLYGPGDNFDLERAHVLPTLIRRFHEAKLKNAPSVTLWGTGTPRREFLYVDDLAEGCIQVMRAEEYHGILNIGTGEDLTIRELAERIARTVGYEGAVVFDATHPDGTPQKLLDVSRICSMGWKPRISLGEGIQRTYDWYCSNYGGATGPAGVLQASRTAPRALRRPLGGVLR